VPKQCPKCGAAFLFEKRDKMGNITVFCHNKECGHKEAETSLEEVTNAAE